jgi:hypothetical protein
MGTVDPTLSQEEVDQLFVSLQALITALSDARSYLHNETGVDWIVSERTQEFPMTDGIGGGTVTEQRLFGDLAETRVVLLTFEKRLIHRLRAAGFHARALPHWSRSYEFTRVARDSWSKPW